MTTAKDFLRLVRLAEERAEPEMERLRTLVDRAGYGTGQKRQVLERYPRDYPWWLPLPALPEKEDGTPVIARREYPQKPASGLIDEE